MSRTIWGIVFTTISAIAPLVGEKIDENDFKARDAAQIIVILCGAATAIVGRMEAGGLYTPDRMIGPSRKDFS